MNKKKRVSLQKISFCINEIDPMGQGVVKESGKITFIAKTLPQETGVASVYKTRKGVSFAKLESLQNTSEYREKPECPHFDTCPGCHYLHTSYENELYFKKNALTGFFRKLNLAEDKLQIVAAPERLSYRNRIQLHYRHKYIGLIDSINDEVVEIPHCQIIREELKPAMQKLYDDKSWAKEHKGSGHCELYLKDNAVSIRWDDEYSHGGFTQVNEAMNQVLCETVSGYMKQVKPQSVLDLFAGNGNLTNRYVESSAAMRKMVDYSDENTQSDYCRINLFEDNALKVFQNKCKDKHFDILVLDPPRKGFPAINRWVKRFKPDNMIYVSCNTATMARDLESIDNKYTVENVTLLDLFPSTWHFETVAFLSFKY